MYTYIQELIIFFFFNDTATTEIYTLSLHDALPIWRLFHHCLEGGGTGAYDMDDQVAAPFQRMFHEVCDVGLDRKSTRLNSSHANISYAVFCLKKKKIKPNQCLWSSKKNDIDTYHFL